MGIGMAVVCSKIKVDKLIQELPGAKIIGQVINSLHILKQE
jgi:phosphoribosylaminoimidazole (AIR) synthetase